MLKITKVLPFTIILLALAACNQTVAQTSDDKVEEKVVAAEPEREIPDIVTTDLGQGVYMLTGAGGNIGLFSGEDGHLVIDDQFDYMVPNILAAVKAIADKPIKYVVNTHYHGDHAGGNVEMHEHGADIVAHDNVRKRLSTPTENKQWGRTTQPMAAEAWPVITYSNASSLYMNDGSVKLVHAPNGHTDGDSLVYFMPANVLHMGDNFFFEMLPYIDVDGGGSINGMIAAHDLALSMTNDDTKIIPGHGALASKADLQKTRDMLADIRSIVQAGIDAGEDVDTLVARNPLEKYTEYGKWITPEIMTRITFRSLTGS
jgi:glyoxylase-like metal-dependent hydrolase (beta-lactamase superfamily II)